MAQLKDLDIKSLVIGSVFGIALIFALFIWKKHHKISPPPLQAEEEIAILAPPSPEVPDYREQFEHQQRVEQALEEKVQTLMDQIIGRDRSRVRIHVDLDFGRHESTATSADPGEVRMVTSEETRETNSAEQGAEEHAKRAYELNRTMRKNIDSAGALDRVTMALTIDQTKVVYNLDTEVYEIEDRTQEEIDQLRDLAQTAVGIDATRGDEVSVYSMPFDKSQEIQAHRAAEDIAQREFWTGVAINLARVLGLIAAFLLLRWFLKRNDLSDFVQFLKEPESMAALLTAAGLFFCANALGFWGSSLSWKEIGFLPGAFALIVGGHRMFLIFRSRLHRESVETT